VEQCLDGTGRHNAKRDLRVGPLVTNYSPYQNFTSEQLAKDFWDPTLNHGQGGWKYDPINEPEGVFLALRNGPLWRSADRRSIWWSGGYFSVTRGHTLSRAGVATI
jgi:hypothetical protein